MSIRKLLTGTLLVVAGMFMLSASTIQAQDFCEGLADYDQDVDADDVEEFLNHFGRHQFNNPCPPDGPAPVAKTGQTTSYATGDDGDLEKGVALPNPRFTDNGDGTVTDNVTGLIWLRDANCSLFGATLDWFDTLNLNIPQLEDGYCGLTDGSSAGEWRLPNRFELESLLDLENYDPALPSEHPFTNVRSSTYWSSSTFAHYTDSAWYVSMSNGYVLSSNKANRSYVWPVRGGR